jgi:hypothetical protein
MNGTTLTKPAPTKEPGSDSRSTDESVAQQPERHGRGRRNRVLAISVAVLTGVVLVAVLVLAVATLDQSPSAPIPDAPTVLQRELGPDNLPLSADAAERWTSADRSVPSDAWPRTADAAAQWAAAERQARYLLCTSAPISADAVERCLSRPWQ